MQLYVNYIITSASITYALNVLYSHCTNLRHGRHTYPSKEASYIAIDKMKLYRSCNIREQHLER